CELCYECVHCENCYGCLFSENCKNCSEAWFLKNCVGCSNCFGCVDLANKSHYFFNEKCTEAEYVEKFKKLNLHSHTSLRRFAEQFTEYAEGFSVPYYQGTNNENVSGNYIFNSKNAQDCFDVNDVEDCMYCDNLTKAKNCFDVSFYGASALTELAYQCEAVGHGAFQIFFSKLIWGGCSDIYYSYECFSSQNLFGCAGLKKAQHCILNKQYAEDEYDALVRKIVQHMKNTGEWGAFFPATFSPFGYNETGAHEYFPLTKTAALGRGLKWDESDLFAGSAQAPCTVPDSIVDVEDDILEASLVCEVSGKCYRIERPELEFYRKLGIPVPAISPHLRHLERIKRRNNRILYDAHCSKCTAAFQTTYEPQWHDRVLCKPCYLDTIE
ncbi:hypothetical protein OAO01_07945, partial [Oligoflexia bacterium]|nr:hypothetical protein [Oligoflexia bacterium]